MIVYAESNFLIEIALAQEQAMAAEAILALAERQAITLVVPAFALSEPFSNLKRRANERNHMIHNIQREVRELERSATHQPVGTQLRPILAALLDIGDQQTEALLTVVDRVLRTSTFPTFDTAVFGRVSLYRQSYSLSAQDAVVYASIRADLETRDRAEPKCFLSRDSKGFQDVGIKEELRPHNCRVIYNFADGLRYIESVVAG